MEMFRFANHEATVTGNERALKKENTENIRMTARHPEKRSNVQ